MSATINPRSRGAHEGRRLAARSPQSTPGSYTGMAWGLLMARMEARVTPPGGVERTQLVWVHCKAYNIADPCTARGPVLICGRCWDTDRIFAGLTVLGPLTASVGILCERCGGKDLEVVGYDEPTEDSKIAGRMYYSPQTHQLEEWQ